MLQSFTAKNLLAGGTGLTLASVTPNEASSLIIAIITGIVQLVHLFKKRKNKKDAEIE